MYFINVVKRRCGVFSQGANFEILEQLDLSIDHRCLCPKPVETVQFTIGLIDLTRRSVTQDFLF